MTQKEAYENWGFMETLLKEDFCFEISCSTASSIERQNVSQPLNDYTIFRLFGAEKFTCHKTAFVLTKIQIITCSIAHMPMNSPTRASRPTKPSHERKTNYQSLLKKKNKMLVCLGAKNCTAYAENYSALSYPFLNFLDWQVCEAIGRLNRSYIY